MSGTAGWWRTHVARRAMNDGWRELDAPCFRRSGAGRAPARPATDYASTHSMSWGRAASGNRDRAFGRAASRQLLASAPEVAGRRSRHRRRHIIFRVSQRMTDLRQPVDTDHERRADMPLSLGVRSIRLSSAIIGALADEGAPYGLSPVEFNLLLCCAESGECTATQLARVLPIDASRISRVVTRLVDKELLLRRRLPHDRRTVMLRLTNEGARLVAQLGDRVEAYVLRLLAGCNEQELRTVESISVRMQANHAAMLQTE